MNGARIVFGGAPESLDEGGAADIARDLWKYDVVKRTLHELEWWAERHDVVPDPERVVPSADVMQRLVAELGAR